MFLFWRGYELVEQIVLLFVELSFLHVSFQISFDRHGDNNSGAFIFH